MALHAEVSPARKCLDHVIVFGERQLRRHKVQGQQLCFLSSQT